jgi:hypothetical protein
VLVEEIEHNTTGSVAGASDRCGAEDDSYGRRTGTGTRHPRAGPHARVVQELQASQPLSRRSASEERARDLTGRGGRHRCALTTPLLFPPSREGEASVRGWWCDLIKRTERLQPHVRVYSVRRERCRTLAPGITRGRGAWRGLWRRRDARRELVGSPTPGNPVPVDDDGWTASARGPGGPQSRVSAAAMMMEYKFVEA